MRRLRQLKAAALLAGAIVLGFSIGPALNGCASESDPFGGVIASIGFDPYRLSDDGRSELARYDAYFAKYASDPQNSRQKKHFHDAFKRIHKAYVEDVPESQLIELAIKGIEEKEAEPGSIPADELVEISLDAMTAGLDPHSSYLTAEELRESELVTSGEFGGLGIQVTQHDQLIKVIAPLEGTPADRAGIKPGDLITHLDGQSVEGISLKDAVTRMRGRPGTTIQLSVVHPDGDSQIVPITRAVITIDPVRWAIEDDIGYIRIVGFNEKAAERLEDALISLNKEQADLKGLVIDLRNNPGGLLDQSIAVADLLLDHGLILTIKGREASSERSFMGQSRDLTNGLPLVVLINGGSASAAEIVAGALNDRRRAVVMGAPSFGKGSVQTVMRLPEGGALKLTTAMYYTPSGRAIQAIGVMPDIRLVTAAEDEENPHEADLPGAFPPEAKSVFRSKTSIQSSSCAPYGDDHDREIGCAMSYLRAGSTESFRALLKSPSSL